MSGGARVSAENVWKRYGRFDALRDCSLRAAAGEILGLAGPNGAGKSTLARLICGFELPSRGRLTTEGLPPHVFRGSRGVGYLPEELPRTRGLRVIDFLRMKRIRKGAGADLEQVTVALGLQPLLHKPLLQLSKGQLRLAGAAYALLGGSQLVLLDEPDTGLDPVGLDSLAVGVRAAAASGSTVIILSHALDEMERVCDRILFLFSGRVTGELTARGNALAGAREMYRSLACAGAQ